MHERALRMIYQNDTSTLEELLNKDIFVKIHTRNLQILVTEMFKVKKNNSTTITGRAFSMTNRNRNSRNKR